MKQPMTSYIEADLKRQRKRASFCTNLILWELAKRFDTLKFSWRWILRGGEAVLRGHVRAYSKCSRIPADITGTNIACGYVRGKKLKE